MSHCPVQRLWLNSVFINGLLGLDSAALKGFGLQSALGPGGAEVEPLFFSSPQVQVSVGLQAAGQWVAWVAVE